MVKGIDLDFLACYVAGVFDLTTDDLFSPGRYPKRVKARSLLFYWAVRELGLTATELGKKTGMTQPAVSVSVERGELIDKENNHKIDDILTIIIFMDVPSGTRLF